MPGIRDHGCKVAKTFSELGEEVGVMSQNQLPIIFPQKFLPGRVPLTTVAFLKSSQDIIFQCVAYLKNIFDYL